VATPPSAKTVHVSATPDPTPVLTSPPLPSGTVTFAFTDIEGRTQRWERDRPATQDAERAERRGAPSSNTPTPDELTRLLAEGAALSPQAAIALALEEP
jgi:hypothetical protein